MKFRWKMLFTLSALCAGFCASPILVHAGNTKNTVVNLVAISDGKGDIYEVLDWRGVVRISGRLVRKNQTFEYGVATITFSKTSDYLVVVGPNQSFFAITPKSFAQKADKGLQCKGIDCDPTLISSIKVAGTKQEFYVQYMKPVEEQYAMYKRNERTKQQTYESPKSKPATDVRRDKTVQPTQMTTTPAQQVDPGVEKVNPEVQQVQQINPEAQQAQPVSPEVQEVKQVNPEVQQVSPPAQQPVRQFKQKAMVKKQ